MGFLKTKKGNALKANFQESRDNRDYEQFRLKESTDVEHLHMQSLKAVERIEELRAALEKKKRMKESLDHC